MMTAPSPVLDLKLDSNQASKILKKITQLTLRENMVKMVVLGLKKKRSFLPDIMRLIYMIKIKKFYLKLNLRSISQVILALLFLDI